MAVHKGISDAQVQGMFQHATQMAAAAGLEYHLEKAVPANSFDAHRLLQYAEEEGRGNEMEETLFQAFFMDGKNIADRETLTRLGVAAGLEEKDLGTAFTEEKYASAVHADIAEAEDAKHHRRAVFCAEPEVWNLRRTAARGHAAVVGKSLRRNGKRSIHKQS